ncbi:MAG: PIG-L family deacetylase [Actinomycetota bacterium]
MTTPMTTAQPHRLLGVWAHPDDEAYLSAGLMAEVVDRGGAVTVVAVTDGELGFPADDDRLTEVKAKQRRSELLDALAALGVHDVRFLGHPDGRLAELRGQDLAAELVPIMRSVRPTMTVTFGPDGITGHDDHIAAGQAATAAWMETRMGGLWYAAKSSLWLDEWRATNDAIGIWMGDEPDGVRTDAIELALTLDGPALDQKRAALAAHGSQTDRLASMLGEPTYRRWIAEETFRRPTDVELADVDAALAMANWCHR